MEDCRKIVQLVSDHRERKLKDKAGYAVGKGLWAAAKFVLGKLVGRAGGPVLEVFKPKKMGTGVDGYYDTLDKFLTAVEDGADAQRLQPLVDNLGMWERHIRIEKEFGVNSNCYDSIGAITQDAVRHVNEAGKGGKGVLP